MNDTLKNAVDELQNYMRKPGDYMVCRACDGLLQNGHTALCPIGIVFAALSTEQDPVRSKDERRVSEVRVLQRWCNRDGCRDSHNVGGNYGSEMCTNPEHWGNNLIQQDDVIEEARLHAKVLRECASQPREKSSTVLGWKRYVDGLDRKASRVESLLALLEDGERVEPIGYVSRADFDRAAAQPEYGDPLTPAALTPIWHDSVPVYASLHPTEMSGPNACADCGARHWYNFMVPEDVWARICPVQPYEDGLGGMLCAQCIDRRCIAAGINGVEGQFFFTGEAVTSHPTEEGHDG